MARDEGAAESAAAIVAAVRACVGTRFRAQGRMPGLALDCVGVALVAARAAGMAAVAVPPYALGGDHAADIATMLAGLGCIPVPVAGDGDLLIIAPTAVQRHLAVVTPAGVVHAHAGIGRVVEGPIDPGWTIMGAWRLSGVRAPRGAGVRAPRGAGVCAPRGAGIRVLRAAGAY